MSKGHILFINRVFPPDSGASGLRLMELCQGLAERGWRITVLTGRGRNIRPDNLHANITLVRATFGTSLQKPKYWQYPFYMMGFLFRAMTLPRADIVVTLTDPPMSALISAQVGSFRRMRAVHWVHDLYPDLLPVMGVRLPIVQPILQLLSRLSMRAHDRIVTIGQDMKDVLVKQHVSAQNIAVIPNWPDVKSAHLDKKRPTRAQSENPFILENTFTVLYSGNFGLVHDFDAYIDAIKIVQQSPYPIRFIFAGEGRKFNAVRERVESMALTNTHFVRAQPKDKFIDMLLAGDLHVATMIPEAAGLVAPSKINSALGLGRPCLLIGSKHSFQGELIDKFKAGRVVEMSDPQAKFQLADAIIHYATNEDAYTAARDNALRAADSISFDKALTSFDTLFTDLIAK